MIMTIAGRELRSLFLSPLAWAILATVQFIIAYLFLSQIEAYSLLQPRLAALQGAPGVSDIVVAPLFADAAVVLLLTDGENTEMPDPLQIAQLAAEAGVTPA